MTDSNSHNRKLTRLELLETLMAAPDHERSAVIADASATLGSLQAVYDLLTPRP